jgi:glyoxylase-like metal-dependent hydrolase (beta-lactamase superfamily II)
MSNDAGVLVTGGSGMMRYPVPGYAVVHERGVVVFDTGLHDALMSSSDELGALADVFTIELTPADLVESRLAEHGVEIGAVTHVVNSHLHFDHCGRNGPLAHATTLVQRAEWDAAQRPGRTTYVGVPMDEIAAARIELLDGAHDVFGDGTVVCVPTPGHTAGHQSLLVRASTDAGAEAALLVGDACYLASMLAGDVLPPFAFDRDRQRQSYDVLRQHASDGTRLLFSHDVERWDQVPASLSTAPNP